MRVIVCGGRDYADAAHLAAMLERLPVTAVAHGAAKGADTLAELWCRDHGIEPARYPADWTGPCRDTCRPGHRRNRWDGTEYCPAAGNYRNQAMLDDFAPDAVIALPGGTGTADMTRRAHAANVPVNPSPTP